MEEEMDARGSVEAEEPLMGGTDEKEAWLPPKDGGAGAWKCLIGCWFIEAMIWGFQLTFGVFQAHYESHPLFRDSNAIASIGLCGAAMSYFGVLVVTPIALRFPKYQWHVTCVGFLTCVASLVAASFAQRAWQLVLTQGIMYGTGWVVTFTPFLIMLNEWFDEKRGLAYGILYGSSGISGLVLPFVLETLLQKTSFRTTLRVYAGVTVLIGGPGLFLITPRFVAKPVSPIPRKVPWFLKDKVFWIFALACFLQGFGFLIPRYLMPSYAQALGLKQSQGDFLLSVLALAQVLGQMSLGHLSDMVNVHIPVSLAVCVPAAAVFFLWGPAKTVTPLIMFSLVYNSFGAAFSVLWTRIAMYLTADSGTAMSIYGVFSFVRGVSYVVAGPLSSALEKDEIDVTKYGLLRYQGVIWFVGVTMMLSAFSGIGYIWREDVANRRLFEKMAQAAREFKFDNEIGRRLDGTNQELQTFIVASDQEQGRTSSSDSTIKGERT
ncbi:MAG: hypothetical protein M1828_002548 [Chrysothrix sp. TS-e1954]|nr:MAG: hypothetical protein M1828_002548 [Chrysothrix sp. TS-e1954]